MHALLNFEIRTQDEPVSSDSDLRDWMEGTTFEVPQALLRKTRSRSVSRPSPAVPSASATEQNRNRSRSVAVGSLPMLRRDAALGLGDRLQSPPQISAEVLGPRARSGGPDGRLEEDDEEEERRLSLRPGALGSLFSSMSG